MTAYAYYNEIDPVACAVLKEAIKFDIITPGYVDSRSIKDIRVEDLYGFEQHHFFAGAGLWSVACRLAGWPDDRPIWTASCPCQGWSVAGKGLGFDDPRDLWPDLFRLWRAYRPAVGVGEITSGSAVLPWLDRTCADLEGEDYACRAVSVPACAVDTPNIRQRLWWSALAHPNGSRSSEIRGNAPEKRGFSQAKRQPEHDASLSGRIDGAPIISVAHPDSRGRDGRQEDAQRRSIGRDAVERFDADLGDASGAGLAQRSIATDERRALRDERPPLGPAVARSWWSDSEWIACADGKARRAPSPESYFRDVAPGLSAGIEHYDPARMLVASLKGRADAWRIAGNAINPQLAAQVIHALKDELDVK